MMASSCFAAGSTSRHTQRRSAPTWRLRSFCFSRSATSRLAAGASISRRSASSTWVSTSPREIARRASSWGNGRFVRAASWRTSARCSVRRKEPTCSPKVM